MAKPRYILKMERGLSRASLWPFKENNEIWSISVPPAKLGTRCVLAYCTIEWFELTGYGNELKRAKAW